MLKPLLFVSFLLLSTGSFAASDGDWELITVVPRHEADGDSSLVAFLDSLESAVMQKDTVFIFRHLHDNVKVSFGYPSSGTSAFVEHWKPSDESSTLWPNMLRSIRGGGGWSTTVWVSRNDSSFMMPYRIDPRDYICTRRLPDESQQSMQFQLEEGGAYVGDTLRVLHIIDEKPVQFPEQPWQDKPSPELLRRFGIEETSVMIRAYLPDQRRGYIPCEDITSHANGCELHFIKAENEWKIICCMGEYSDLRMGRKNAAVSGKNVQQVATDRYHSRGPGGGGQARLARWDRHRVRTAHHGRSDD